MRFVSYEMAERVSGQECEMNYPFSESRPARVSKSETVHRLESTSFPSLRQVPRPKTQSHSGEKEIRQAQEPQAFHRFSACFFASVNCCSSFDMNSYLFTIWVSVLDIQ